MFATQDMGGIHERRTITTAKRLSLSRKLAGICAHCLSQFVADHCHLGHLPFLGDDARTRIFVGQDRIH